MNWHTLLFFAALLWITPRDGIRMCKAVQRCIESEDIIVVADKFNGVWTQGRNFCAVFLQKNATRQRTERWDEKWPQIETKDPAFQLSITKWHIKEKIHLTVLEGNCTDAMSKLKGPKCDFRKKTSKDCEVWCLHTEICGQASFNENFCRETFPQVAERYIINMSETTENCLSCRYEVKEPKEKLDREILRDLGVTLQISEEGIDPVQAANVIEKMESLATLMNTSSAALDLGGGVTGILVKEEPDDVDEVSFGYASPNASIKIVESRSSLAQYSRSVTVTKESFEQAISMNTSVPFVAILRFLDMEKDELNSTLLGNEVLSIDMGTAICNLTDKININFWNMEYEGIPSCQSWSSNGSLKWTDDGCETVINGTNITCLCSHLTFFAILLTPLNETLSSSDARNLTIITQVGCSLSILFLGVILFMHFLIRRAKASTTTIILIHLVSSMFLLNFAFLVNHYVAKLKSSVGCTAMAAVMHYFLLTTFTWFALQAFHFCLQLHSGGKVVIRHYMLKVCITGWALPCVFGIALLATGKYGEQIIYTDDPKDNVAMCWVTDSNVQYYVNIGYYFVVFLFTFTIFLIIVTRLFHQKTQAGNTKRGRNILTILGLCCMLGITWGFALFAYGPLLIPFYYIFTIFNSFQGFFLFLYYHNTSQVGDINSVRDSSNKTSTSSVSTMVTQDGSENPYRSLPAKR